MTDVGVWVKQGRDEDDAAVRAMTMAKRRQATDQNGDHEERAALETVSGCLKAR